MKAKTFENLIRKVVREEIDYALRREIKSLKEDLRDEVSPQIIDETPNTQMPIPKKSSLKETIMGGTSRKKSIKKQFVSNGTLNDLLNETAMGDTNLDTGHSPVSLAEPFATGDPMPLEAQGMPPSVANAMTRDYSDLMKAMDKKKNK
jgi:hypothetical protein